MISDETLNHWEEQNRKRIHIHPRVLGHLIAEIRQLREEVKVSDKLIAERDRVLDELPCKVHGRCVPGAIEQIEMLRKIKDAAKAFYESDFVMVEEHWERDGRTKIIIPIEENLKAALAEYEGEE